MNKETLHRIEKQLDFLERNKNHLTIDADTHLTDLSQLEGDILTKYRSSPNYYHGRPISAEDLLREMKMAQVDMSLIWQNPAATVYTDDQVQNFTNLLAANTYIYESAQAYPEKFIPAGWTDPKALGVEKALKMVAICLQELGFFIVKMNPAQNAYPLDSEEVVVVVDKIISLGGVPAFHYGADTPYTTPEGLEKLAKRYPDQCLMAVHMGGGGAGYVEAEEHYLKTRKLGLEYPNLFFPLSAKRDTHIESDLITYQLAGKPYKHNMACASDAPYGRQTWNFGGYRAMLRSLMDEENHVDKRIRKNTALFNEEMIQNFMGRNFAEFTIKGYKKFLQVELAVKKTSNL